MFYPVRINQVRFESGPAPKRYITIATRKGGEHFIMKVWADMIVYDNKRYVIAEIHPVGPATRQQIIPGFLDFGN